MNETTSRGLLAAGLSCNVLLLALALLDYSLFASQYMWPIFVSWAFIIVMMVVLAFVSAVIRIEVVHTQALPTGQGPRLAQPAVAAAVQVKTPPAPLPFKFNGYTLYSRPVLLKGDDRTRNIYFFAKASPKSGDPIPKPLGYHVGVNERTGLPFLKKGTGADGEDLTPELVHAYRPQCAALTEQGHQCRNSARGESRYCISHFGYQPPAIALAEAARQDSRPRVSQAKDTQPAVRRRASV